MEQKSKVIKRDCVDEQISLENRLELEEFAEKESPVSSKIISESEVQALSQSEVIVNKAQEESKRVKEKAKELYLQVETKMAEAKKQGFEQGRQEGLATVTGQLVQIEAHQKKLIESIEKESVSLVYEIAQKIVGNALKTDDEAVLGLIKQALHASLGNHLTIFVNPNDYERIREKETQLTNLLQTTQTLSIKPTENVKEAGCVIESEMGTIDAQLDYQLEAIKKALGVGS
ncbi:MAG: flagellar assembly protein FliH [uncultured bacterium]|nr:MAG: flagellar assembly protein FliH [uncultured bacterium]HLD44006.1 FliH/SctL family protein [bacterium]